MSAEGIYIGLMSGTSLDGIDVVAVRFSPEFELICSHSFELPEEVRSQILAICSPGDNEIDRMGLLDQTLAKLFADAALELIDKHGLDKDEIAAIGSHGQTIRHRPESAFTLQIGNPSLIAEHTGITTVADFRPRDMAAGGEGAPLVPAFHKALFRCTNKPRIILNIGGMANITWLPADSNEKVLGYDTGPGNVLMDSWIARHLNKNYDAHGNWAATGTADELLVRQMLSLPYFSQPAPKSTGREQFNMAWLEAEIARCNSPVSHQDIQATLLELTARSIADQIQLFNRDTNPEVYVCGGGSHNDTLLNRLSTLLPDNTIKTTQALNLHPDWVEAAAFGWLAKQTLNNLPGNLPDVTGAKGERILGAIYPA
ncbi:anhydro-N-acetylmuramic acid kinase [Pontibacterium sp.]|uniref:anhydro-N-acetylmuramic acid kinase n=1 Tax=Pontibacterium sp. TaxID=2036026 RepID=UPI003514B06C